MRESEGGTDNNNRFPLVCLGLVNKNCCKLTLFQVPRNAAKLLKFSIRNKNLRIEYNFTMTLRWFIVAQSPRA